jgi:hypothetical protein
VTLDGYVWICRRCAEAAQVVVCAAGSGGAGSAAVLRARVWVPRLGRFVVVVLGRRPERRRELEVGVAEGEAARDAAAPARLPGGLAARFVSAR